jgi:hypothetical protein
VNNGEFRISPELLLMVTPGATTRLEKLPRGALSKVMRLVGPTAVLKEAWAAFEAGRGSVLFAPLSKPENTIGAACRSGTATSPSREAMRVVKKRARFASIVSPFR